MVTKDLRNEVFDLIYGKDRIEEAILKLNGIIKSSPENSRAIALKAYRAQQTGESPQSVEVLTAGSGVC